VRCKPLTTPIYRGIYEAFATQQPRLFGANQGLTNGYQKFWLVPAKFFTFIAIRSRFLSITGTSWYLPPLLISVESLNSIPMTTDPRYHQKTLNFSQISCVQPKLKNEPTIHQLIHQLIHQ